MKVIRVLTMGIAALALAAPAVAATATLTAAPAQADCSGPGYSGNPFDCQDPYPTGAIDASQLPSQIGPDGGQDWGRGLPPSTDPWVPTPWQRPSLVTAVSWTGRAGSSSSIPSASKGSGTLVPAWPGICVPRASGSAKSGDRIGNAGPAMAKPTAKTPREPPRSSWPTRIWGSRIRRRRHRNAAHSATDPHQCRACPRESLRHPQSRHRHRTR